MQRWDRFIADVELDDGCRVRAHCVNPGRMEGQVQLGMRVWLAPNDSPSRKLKFTWELAEERGDVPGGVAGRLVGVNTQAPNRIAAAALQARALPGFRRFTTLRAEVPYMGRSRIDFLLGGRRPHYVEVKNVHLVYPDDRAYFPDTTSERAQKHVGHLEALAKDGAKASVVFFVQRPGKLRAVRPSAMHDPALSQLTRQAAAAGVRFRAFQIRPTTTAYEILRAIPVDLGPYDFEHQHRWREERLVHSGWKRSKKAVR